MSVGKRILARAEWFLEWLHLTLHDAPHRPDPVERTCYACRRPLPQAGTLHVEGRDYCDKLCLPTYMRRKFGVGMGDA